MKTEGVIASNVKIMPKGGAAFKVIIPELGDTFPLFINQPSAEIPKLKMFDKVSVEFGNMYADKAGQIRLQDVVIYPLAIKQSVKVA